MIEGGLWYNYKGGLYRVICRARQADNGIPMIVYQDIGTGRIYTRSEIDFMRQIEVEQQDGSKITHIRFVKVSD